MQLGDALILVVSSAIGLALCRTGLDFYGPTLQTLPATEAAKAYTELLAPFVMALTPGLLISAWRHASFPRSDILKQPGVLASLAMTTTLAIFLLSELADVLELGAQFEAIERGKRWHEIARDRFRLGSLAVLAAWVPMMVLGRWRPEPTLIDRTGRALGISWLIASAIYENWE